MSELHGSQFQAARFAQIFARRPAEGMKSVRTGRSFDPTPVEYRVKHFPSQIVRVVRPRIFIGSAKHKIVGSDVFGNLKVIRQDMLQAARHMPEMLLTGFR